MKKKQCLKCKKVMPLTEFYRNKKSGYYSSYCRECSREYIKEYSKEYYSNPENERKHRERDKEYQREKREMGLIDKTEEYRKWLLKNPNGAYAHQLVNRMIKRGEIKRKSCEFCKEENGYAHHDNYYEPLKIRWMCPSCHKRYHLGILVENLIK